MAENEATVPSEEVDVAVVDAERPVQGEGASEGGAGAPDPEPELAAIEAEVVAAIGEETAFVPWQDEQGNWITAELVAYEYHVWEGQVSSYELATGLPAPIEDAPETGPEVGGVAPVAGTDGHDGYVEAGAPIPPEPADAGIPMEPT